MQSIAVLITCHNRREKTLACLDALFGSDPLFDARLEVFLVDDGSKDGTSDAIKARYPSVHIIAGDGNLFWCGGMRVAFTVAMELGFDYYLWLNDDTILYPTAIKKLLITSRDLQARLGKGCIVVGSTQDVQDGRHTYGGEIRQLKWKPLSFKLVTPRDVPVECETMDGNCVLIPCAIPQVLGNLGEEFIHAMGDFDYGLRARKSGFSIWVMPGFAGTCSTNTVNGSLHDPRLSFTQRLRKMLQPKGLPTSSWRVFAQRHAGFFWPIFWLWPYAKVMLKGLAKK